MRHPRQLALDLGHRAALGREDFLVAPSNRDAVAWLDRWPAWPAPALVLFGPAGCGKTHLAEVWRQHSGAGLIAAGSIAAAALPVLSGAPLVVEDADRGFEERSLLHLYNMIAEAGRHLLLTARTPPSRWQLALPDLRSRLLAVPAVAVQPPDDSLIAAVLVKLFADRQLRIGSEVVGFLVERMERSFAAARAVVTALDAAALEGRRNVTVPLARQVLQDLGETSAEE